jgi:hypothetical protein
MKQKSMSKPPEYAETARVHRDVSNIEIDDNGNRIESVTFTLEMQEYKYHRAGFATYDDALDAAMAEVERRKGLADTEVIEQIGLAQDDMARMRQRRSDLLQEVATLSRKITANEEYIRELHAAIPAPVSNDYVFDGDPADLAKNEARMRNALAFYFNDDDPWGTVGMRWTPGKDWSKRTPGIQSHVAVGYGERQPNMDF